MEASGQEGGVSLINVPVSYILSLLRRYVCINS